MTYAGNSKGPFGKEKIMIVGLLLSYFVTEVSLHVIGFFSLLNCFFLYFGVFESILGQISFMLYIIAILWAMKLYIYGFSAKAVVQNLPFIKENTILHSFYNLTELNEISFPTILKNPNYFDISFSNLRFWFKLFLPIPRFHCPNIKCQTDIVYHTPDPTLQEVESSKWKLDVYFDSTNQLVDRPIFIYIHGGAWIVGDKREQGLPILYHLASKGWVCFTINCNLRLFFVLPYFKIFKKKKDRLSPKNKWPKHIIDCKRAVAWIKKNCRQFKASPDYVVISGGSAGGHLCTLLCLTPNEPEFEPGLEKDSTSVQACVSIYGVYDFSDRNKLCAFDFKKFLSHYVIDVKNLHIQEEWNKASPIDRVTIHSKVPFFAIHGDLDELVPVESCRNFLAHYQKIVSDASLYYLELPGTHHAFDLMLSPRTIFTIYAIEKFLYDSFVLHQIQNLKNKEQKEESNNII